jgi:hypothetical protein
MNSRARTDVDRPTHALLLPDAGAPTAEESHGEPTIAWFEDLALGDVQTAGGKGANLGELARAGIPVPPGFVITAQAFRSFLGEAGLERELGEILARLNEDDEVALRDVTAMLQGRIRATPIPDCTRIEIENAYAELARRCKSDAPGPFVAVRSSATVEDMPGASFAGMNETCLDVRGKDALIDAVRTCWASLYGSRVVFYRRKKKIPEAAIAMAVVVQVMVESESAGVIFTVNPATGDQGTLIIESAFGLGESPRRSFAARAEARRDKPSPERPGGGPLSRPRESGTSRESRSRSSPTIGVRRTSSLPSRAERCGSSSRAPSPAPNPGRPRRRSRVSLSCEASARRRGPHRETCES